MEYEGFKKEILNMTSIDLNLYKEKQMKRRITALKDKRNFGDFKDYVEALKKDKELYNEFIGYITINVSEFYRNPEQWKILEGEVIPEIIKKTKKIKVWSAACSSGDEPYTLAMVIRKYLSYRDIEIIATDIDKEILKKAKVGRYSEKSLAGLPLEYKNAYFNRDGETYIVSEEIKRCVTFQEHNLLKDSYPQNLDLIVCRNVLIYFTEEAKGQIYHDFNKSLKGEGFLFIGSTEQILLPGHYGFKARKTFFYNKDLSLVGASK